MENKKNTNGTYNVTITEREMQALIGGLDLHRSRQATTAGTTPKECRAFRKELLKPRDERLQEFCDLAGVSDSFLLRHDIQQEDELAEMLLEFRKCVA